MIIHYECFLCGKLRKLFDMRIYIGKPSCCVLLLFFISNTFSDHEYDKPYFGIRANMWHNTKKVDFTPTPSSPSPLSLPPWFYWDFGICKSISNLRVNLWPNLSFVHLFSSLQYLAKLLLNIEGRTTYLEGLTEVFFYLFFTKKEPVFLRCFFKILFDKKVNCDKARVCEESQQIFNKVLFNTTLICNTD